MTADTAEYGPAVRDAVANLLEVVGTLDLSPEDLSAFDTIANLARELEVPFAAAAYLSDVDISPAVVSLAIELHLVHWSEGGWIPMADLRDLTLASSTGSTPAGALVRALAQVGTELAHLEGKRQVASGSATTLALLDLATLLHADAEDDLAFRCALAGTNFVRPYEPAFAEAVEVATRLADLDDPNLRAVTFTRRAQHLASRAFYEPSLRIDAFDAMEVALAALGVDTPNRAEMAGALKAIADDVPYLRALAEVFELLAPDDEMAGLIDQLRPAFQRVLDEPDPVKWVERLYVLGHAAIATENARLALVKPPKLSLVETKWETFAFDHPAFARSVPSDYSIRRDPYADELVLVLAHETAHVLTLWGSFGLAMLALRMVALDRELALWTFSGVLDESVLAMRRPAPLTDGNLLALAQAEQLLELIAKQRVLQRVLTPWLEGVAVFVELAADPNDDPDAFSIVTEIMLNLEDRYPHQEAEEHGQSVDEAVKGILDEAQDRYAGALHRLGRSRLHDVFERDADRYLAGYLLVRAVVASWRKEVPGLTGAQAARLLLHATRLASGVMPDLALSLERFEKELSRRFEAWLGSLSAIDSETIGKLVTAYHGTDAFRWSGSSLVRVDPEEDQAEAAVETYRTFVDQAANSLVGERADLRRIAEASEECRAVMEAVAEALTVGRTSAHLTTAEFFELLVGRLSVVPIATASTPFWFNPSRKEIGYLLRTREKDRETGQPSYNIRTLALDAAASIAVARAVERGARRVLISRVALLTRTAHLETPGTNLMAFSLDEWFQLERRGVLSGSSFVDDDIAPYVQARLMPPGVLEYEAAVVAPGGPVAQRTLAWLTSVDRWHEEDQDYEIHGWVAHVRRRAASLLAPASTGKDGWRQLAGVLGPVVAAKLEDGELRALSKVDPDWYWSAVSVLFESALAPASSQWLDEHHLRVETLVGPLFASVDGKWDIAPTMSEEEES